MELNTALTLGSLFDGSGGFPLGGLLCGITPVWASEIEPFPIRVTTKRFPFMKHYGDISQMDGGKIEPVDIITFGSPCTDMSIAGRRAGLDGKQSVLFYVWHTTRNDINIITDSQIDKTVANLFGILCQTTNALGFSQMIELGHQRRIEIFRKKDKITLIIGNGIYEKLNLLKYIIQCFIRAHLPLH